MKNVLIGLLVIISFTSYAEETSPQSGRAIVNEVVLSLEKHELKCYNEVSNSSFSSKKLDIKATLGGSYILVIQRDEQPAILISKTQKKESEEIYLSVEITTDDSYKQVIGLKAIRLIKNKPVKEQVNVGTIIDPVYEVITREVPDTVLENITCD